MQQLVNFFEIKQVYYNLKLPFNTILVENVLSNIHHIQTQEIPFTLKLSTIFYIQKKKDMKHL